MIPKYPYQVRVTSSVLTAELQPSDKIHQQTKSFETAAAAVTFMAAQARMPRTRRVELLLTLEDLQLSQVRAAQVKVHA